MISLRSGAATDTGQVRSNNQDAVLVAEPMFAVADGMGGHAAGEIASQVAVESLQSSSADSADALAEAVRQANRAVWERAKDDADLRGMGTTMCVINLVPGAGGSTGDRILVANVGDSRVYQFHDGDILQITDDHSLVEDLVREGRLSPEEARTHPQRNILTRVLGNDPDVEVDTWEIDAIDGDRYLLCSDGLFNEVEDDRIASVLRRLSDPEDAAHELVAMANQGGGRDNISVVVVDVIDDEEGGRSATTAVGAATTATAAAPAAGAGTSLTTPIKAGATAGATDGGASGSSGRGAAPTAPATGTTGPRPAHTTAPDATGSSRPDPGGKDRGARPRRMTWRSVLFVLSVLVVLGGAVGAVTWFARSAYYVGVDGEEVAIFRGRPGGLLWIEPKLAERTDLALDDVPPARLEAVTSGKEEPTLASARDYVEALEEQAEQERRATSTTTSTTSTTSASLPDPPG